MDRRLLITLAAGFALMGCMKKSESGDLKAAQSNVVASETYLLAKNVTIKSQEEAEGKTTLSLEYDLPCWASPVDLVDVLDIQGSRVNPAANFAVAVSVLIKGNLRSPCLASSRKTVSKVINTNAVEGRFLGFRVISK